MGGGENLTFKFSCNCKYRWYELNKRNLKTWELNPGTSGLIRNENVYSTLAQLQCSRSTCTGSSVHVTYVHIVISQPYMLRLVGLTHGGIEIY